MLKRYLKLLWSMRAHTHFFKDRDTNSNLFITDMHDFEKVTGKLAEGTYPTKPNEIIVGYHFAQTLLNEAERDVIQEKK